MSLGADVCGYPGIVHGGLTAALVDEAMGHLFYALRTHGHLPFVGPAFTAALEVSYKKRIPAGSLLLVTCDLDWAEGRKLRLTARVADGPGEGATVYATAGALFVAPRLTRVAGDIARVVVGKVASAVGGGGGR